MPALGFKNEFVEQIKSGKKTQTIRLVKWNKEKNWLRIKLKDDLYLYEKWRTKARKLIAVKQCKETFLIDIDPVDSEIRGRNIKDDLFDYFGFNSTVAEEYPLSFEAVYDIAMRDGFGSVGSMYDWFKNQYGYVKIYGAQVIRWR